MKALFLALTVAGMLTTTGAARAEDRGSEYHLASQRYHQHYRSPHSWYYNGSRARYNSPHTWYYNNRSGHHHHYHYSPRTRYYGSPYRYYRSPSYFNRGASYYYGGYSSWGNPYSSYMYPFRGYSSYSLGH